MEVAASGYLSHPACTSHLPSPVLMLLGDVGQPARSAAEYENPVTLAVCFKCPIFKGLEAGAESSNYGSDGGKR